MHKDDDYDAAFLRIMTSATTLLNDVYDELSESKTQSVGEFGVFPLDQVAHVGVMWAGALRYAAVK